MRIVAATLDASVLVPVALADILLRVAERGLFRPVWSSRILDETREAIVEIHPDIDPALIDRRIRLMNETFIGALIDDYGHLERALELPDPDDRHVVAVAMKGRCDAIVTANVRDFPREQLGLLDLQVVTPDEFLLNQLELAPRVVLNCVAEMSIAAGHPLRSVGDVLRILRRAGVPKFADECLRLM